VGHALVPEAARALRAGADCLRHFTAKGAAVCQSTPRWRASAKNVMSSNHNASVAHRAALLVSFARGGTRSCCSGTPAHQRRPFGDVHGPRDGQPPTSASDSTVSTNQSSWRSTVRTFIPGTSNNRSVRGHQDALEAHVHGSADQHVEAFSSINCLVAVDPEGVDTFIPAPPRPTTSGHGTTLESDTPVDVRQTVRAWCWPVRVSWSAGIVEPPRVCWTV